MTTKSAHRFGRSVSSVAYLKEQSDAQVAWSRLCREVRFAKQIHMSDEDFPKENAQRATRQGKMTCKQK